MTRLVCLLTGLAIIATAGTAQADTIQFDFGADNNEYVGNTAPAGITDTVWNGVGTNTPTATGFQFGDGTVATGVTLQTGNSGPTPTGAIDWTAGIGGNRVDQPFSGFYDTLLTTSWLFETNNDNLGVRVSGLAPGVYDVYSIVREPGALTRSYDVGIGVGDIADLSGLAVTSLGDSSGAGASAFVDGQNFATERVTVNSTTDFITVIVDPTTPGNDGRFATISGLQIVPVTAIPEPSSAMLLGLGLFGFVARRRR